MKTGLSSLFRKRILVPLIIAAALAFWANRQQRLHEARRQLEKTTAELTTLTNRVVIAEQELESLREQLQETKKTRDETVVNVRGARHDLAKTDPASRWITPPTDLPAWIEESPYIWLHKDKVQALQVQPFEPTGALRNEVLTVLATDEQQNTAIATALPALLNAYRVLEACEAQSVDQPLSGIENGTIKTVRIKPIPEEGAKLKQRFEAKLREIVGEQRASMLLQLGDYWLTQQFGQKGEPKTISVVRHPNGDYNLSIKSKGNWFSCGIPKQMAAMQFQEHIPPHIAPMFSDIIPELAAGDAGK